MYHLTVCESVHFLTPLPTLEGLHLPASLPSTPPFPSPLTSLMEGDSPLLSLHCHLFTSEVDHVSCSLALWISSLGSYLFIVFAHFPLGCLSFPY